MRCRIWLAHTLSSRVRPRSQWISTFTDVGLWLEKLDGKILWKLSKLVTRLTQWESSPLATCVCEVQETSERWPHVTWGCEEERPGVLWCSQCISYYLMHRKHAARHALRRETRDVYTPISADFFFHVRCCNTLFKHSAVKSKHEEFYWWYQSCEFRNCIFINRKFKQKTNPIRPVPTKNTIADIQLDVKFSLWHWLLHLLR